MTASEALTSAMIAALRADAGVAAAGARVFALQPPPGAPLPYLTVGPDIATDWSSKSHDGREHRLRVTAWDAPRGTALAALLAAAETAAAGLAADLGGHRLVQIRFLRALTSPSASGGPAEGIVEFRARTERAQ
jgi:hypothetical protein